MAGEINGTSCLVQKDGADIVGQGDFTITFNGQPIDISNKSHGDWRTLMDGELSGKGWDLSGTITYNTDSVAQAVRNDAVDGTQGAYTFTWTQGSGTSEAISGAFLPSGLSDSAPMGDRVTTSITFLSSGSVNHTEYSA